MDDSNKPIIKFDAAAKQAAARIRQWPEKTIRLFHHNDADGLTSGAVLSTALERSGFFVTRHCLEKPYPSILEKVFCASGQLIFLTDFAGRISSLISELNAGKNLVVIVDHHPATLSQDPLVINLSTGLYGLRGDRDISASTACFRFAMALDSANADLAWLALVGAVGDGFGINGRLTGENRRVAQIARDQGSASLQISTNGENWILSTFGTRPGIAAAELARILDTLGGTGYYSQGAETGIRLLIEGWNDAAVQWAGELAIRQQQCFFQEIDRIQTFGMNQSDRIQWVQVENRFSPMGVKMIGVFCQQIRTLPFVDPDRYILGAMDLPDKVPGFGAIEGQLSKLSMRLPPALETAVREGKAPGAHTFFPEATTVLGGFSDACHSLAAATVLSRTKIEALVEKMEHLLSGAL